MKAVLFASTFLLATLAGMLILSGGVSAVGPPSDNLTFPESPLKDTREETTPAVDSVLAEISRLPGSPPPTFGLEFSGPSEEDNFRVTGAENWYLFVDINTPGWLYIYEYYPPSSDPPGRWVAYKWKLLQEGQWRLGPFSAMANDPEGLHTYSAWFYGDDQWAAQPAQNNSMAWTYLKSPPAEKPPETPPVPPITEETPPVKGETPGDQFYNFITNPIVLVFGPTVLILIVVFLLLLLRAYRKRALAAAVEASLPAGAAEAPVSGIPQTASYIEPAPLNVPPLEPAAPDVARVRLSLPNGSEIRLTGEQEIGRADLTRALGLDELGLISRKHFRVTSDGGRFFIEDAGSANGTHLNGEDIAGKGPHPLKDNDSIELPGAVRLKFHLF